jgi:hypothetical protein
MPRLSDTRDERPVGPSAEDEVFLDEAAERLKELREQLLELWAVKVAQARLAFWQKAVALVAVLLGVLFVAAWVAVAAFLLLDGVAEGLASASSSRWVGSILAGILGLALVAGGLLCARRMVCRRAAKRADERPHE